MKEFEIGLNDAGQRLDHFARKVTTGLPTSLLYKAIRTKKIKVNRKRCEGGQVLREGDRVQLFLAPDFFGEKEDSFRNLTPRLTVLYEDENFIICDKDEGVSCHPDEVQKTGTLIDHIKAYLYQKGEYCPREENSFAPALCNRIDRNTSGLVIAAKNAAALREMDEAIRARRVKKTYLAWCRGKWEKNGEITLYLKKDEKAKKVAVSPVPRAGFLTAVTEVEPLFYDEKGGRTLLSVRLHTGRTHQIRATLAFLGHPLVGDGKYGKGNKDPVFSHQALRSASLSFAPEEKGALKALAGKTVTAPRDGRFSPKA